MRPENPLSLSDRLSELRERLAAPPPQLASASEADLWGAREALVVRAERFEGLPGFYPVYRFEDFYSWSLIALVVLKGSLRVNPRAAHSARREGFLYDPGNDTIDREIQRVGGPPSPLAGPPLRDADAFVRAWAEALRQDVAEREAGGEGSHVVLAGGRDSLNLLLLPWQKPPLVVSAQPNTPLVRRFVEQNDLGLEVRELCDPRDDGVLTREVLENACRADLRHYRWGAHLASLAAELPGPVTFWKGQVADALTTPYWKTLTHPPGGPWNKLRKVYARLDFLLPGALRRAVARRWLLPSLFRTLWVRCAMFQGAHMGVIRGVSGGLPLSAYHGPRVSAVWRRVCFADAVREDVRPRIGALLHGGPVRYPESNPAPPPSVFRAGLCRPEVFFERLRAGGIPVHGDG